MRILLVHNYYRDPGGEDVVFEGERRMLEQHGHEVVEFVEENERISSMSAVEVARSSIWSSQSKKQIDQLLRKYDIDVAHFYNTFVLISASGYYACAARSVPVIQTLQNYRWLCPAATFFRDNHICEKCHHKSIPFPAILHACYHESRIQSSVVATMLSIHNIARTLHNKVDLFVAPTEFIRRKFVDAGFSPEQIVVKPNPVHPDPGEREQDGSDILFVGRLTEEKGCLTLLRAWEGMGDTPLRIIGDGPLRSEVQGIIHEKGLNSVTIEGHLDHETVIERMKRARFIIFPSEWYEAQPLVLIEALACGVPVISSNIGAINEIIEEKVTGLHFQAGSSEDLAAKVQWAVEHRKDMKAMGSSARRQYEARYSPEKNYEMLMGIYQKGIARTREMENGRIST